MAKRRLRGRAATCLGGALVSPSMCHPLLICPHAPCGAGGRPEAHRHGLTGVREGTGPRIFLRFGLLE